MTELIQAAFSAVGIIPTAFLLFVILYWVAVIFGLLDMEFLHLEIEAELELDDGHAADVSGITWLNSALGFFNLGKIPLMLFLSFLALPFWAITLLIVHYVPAGSGLIGWALLVPSLVAALLVSKILTTPFVKLFSVLEKEHDSKVNIIGQVCTIMLPADSVAMGQAAVKTAGSPLLLNVKTTQGQALQKGQTALVIDYNDENKFYLVEPYETV